MLLRDFFIGISVFALLITGVVAVIGLVSTGGEGDGSDAITVFQDETELAMFNNTFNIQKGLQSNATQLQGSLERLKVESTAGIITLPLAVIQSSWDLVRLVKNSFGFMASAIGGLTGYLGIPSWISTILGIIILFFFVFSILSLLFGNKT